MGDQANPFWYLARLLYRMALVGVFAVVAFGVGPTWFLFGRLTRPVPSDYAAFVNQDCAPILRALVVYEQDFGQPPWDLDQLAPKYLPLDNLTLHEATLDRQGQVLFDTPGLNVRIRYDPGCSQWAAEGPFVSGPIPAPPVLGFKLQAQALRHR